MGISRPILLVDDDSVNAAMAQRALQDLGISDPLVHLHDGQDALDYLRNDRSKPCVILLDLNMPKVGGIEFLKVAKADEELKQIPVVMMTVSDKDQDVERSFELGAAGYMVKSGDYKQFVESVKTIHEYWSLSELPGDD